MPDARLQFDFVDAAGRPAPQVFEHPERIIEARRIEDVRPAMAAAEAAQRAGRYVAGYVAYEAAAAFDDALVTKAPGQEPLVWFGVFEGPAPGAVSEAADGEADETAPARLARIDWTAEVSRDDYDAAVQRVRAAIEAGDSYQANYTFPLRSHIDAASIAGRYRQWRLAQRPPYAAWLDIGRCQILSLSPELFFRLEGQTLTTRPMKGTARRGRFAAEDETRLRALHASPKNRAENVMIVDLMRNDVGRIAEVGSVAVPSLFDIERYPGVFQMTSTVTGQVRPGTTFGDVFAALFPAGSITGAPKSSSMRLIASIERAPRGVYCGAIGLVTPSGDAVFNVAIRTAVVDTATGNITYAVGGGITWDSTAGEEYAEAISKTSFLDVPPAFSLFETLRLDHGVLVRRDRHLARLARSARHLDRPLDAPAAAAALDRFAGRHPAGTRRVRLQVSPEGAATVESWPFIPDPDGPPQPVVLARSPVSSEDVFLFHKTTHRAVYDRHRAAHPDAFDVLLWNERRELTEFTIGNVVVEVDGRRVTPPLECGLLGGVFREHLIETRVVSEQVLPLTALRRATRIWLVNSLREWVPVQLRAGDPADGASVA